MDGEVRPGSRVPDLPAATQAVRAPAGQGPILARSPLPYAVLGVLSNGSLHGYEIHRRITRASGCARRTNIGQVYASLGRLERDRLISKSPSGCDSSDHRRRVVYQLTQIGAQVWESWLSDRASERMRPEGHVLRLVFSLAVPTADPLAIIAAQRQSVEARLALSAADSCGGRDSLGADLFAEWERLHDVAVLNWLAAAERKVRSSLTTT